MNIGCFSYQVLIGDGCFEDVILRAHFGDNFFNRKVSQFVAIIDECAYVSGKVSVPADWKTIYLAGTEMNKTRNAKDHIEDLLLAYNCDKDTVLVSIGGGTIGDLTGFVASTFLRGIRFVQIPTTLLAMVDASVGGKTGVNSDKGKNLIGSFYQPCLVLIDVSFLQTLSDRLFANGVAEIVKAGFIGSPILWSILADIPNIQSFRSDSIRLIKIISESVVYKKKIVEQDERDNGLRNELNFGHTIGHALELLEGSAPLLHGECVAIGMIYELMALRAIKFLESPACISELSKVLSKFDLPTSVRDDIDLDKFINLIQFDKKGSLSTTDAVPIVAVKSIWQVRGDTKRLVYCPLNVALRLVAPFVSVQPKEGRISGHVNVPGSKSVANRALLLAALAGVPCLLKNVPDSADVQIMLSALQALGSPVRREHDSVNISGPFKSICSQNISIHVGNSGTTGRFLLPVAARLLSGSPHLHSVTFTCEDRMSDRPIGSLLESIQILLPHMQINCLKAPNSFPLTLTRKSDAQMNCPVEVVEINGEMSSQFVSAILMMAPLYDTSLTVKVTGLKPTGEAVSQPYIDMTLRMMDMFGCPKVEKSSDGTYRTTPGKYQGLSHYIIPGDAAAASYPLAIAAISGGKVSVNVSNDGLQTGDLEFTQFLRQLGCTVSYGINSTTVQGPEILTPPQGGSIDFSGMTDTFLTGAVLLGHIGKGKITGIDNQRVKECDRITAVALNMNKCGFFVSEEGNDLCFSESSGTACSNHPVIATFNDHRVAMAFSVLSCREPNILIQNPRCVEKTYPGFWDMLETDLGLTITGHSFPSSVAKLQYASAIIGMRGIGKSTLGEICASRVGYRFVDLDKSIEESTAMKIDQIIRDCGWEGFRRIESERLRFEVYAAERTQKFTLISTGGGIVESATAREFLKLMNNVVWMKSDLKTTSDAAVSASEFAPKYTLSVEDVYLRRMPLYESLSSFEVYRNENASTHLARILQGRKVPLPSENSCFVCLTASDYSTWTVSEFQKSIGRNSGVEAVEIRVDKIQQINQFKADFARLQTVSPVPIILTLRRKEEGGYFTGDYIRELKGLLRICPEWIDIETASGFKIEMTSFSSCTRVIASRHFSLVPANLAIAVESVLPAWADVGKIVVPEETDFVSLAFLAREISKRKNIPLIALIAGTNGFHSRLLNSFFTPCAPEDAIGMTPAAIGQLKSSQIEIFRNGLSQVPLQYQFHLFGDPISQSPSPFFHNLMFSLRGISNCVYSKAPCSDIESVCKYVSSPLFRGASVTTPLKESVYDYLVSLGAELGPSAQSSKSVNTIIVGRSPESLRGENTDISALIQCLQNIPTAPGGKNCLVIGTGGAARGAAYAASSCGYTVFVHGRNAMRVTAICSETTAYPFDSSVAGSMDIIIGCVPGEAQSAFITEFPETVQSASHIIEMAYIPRETPLVKAGLARKASVVYGSDILRIQAIAQHNFWVASLLDRGEIIPTRMTAIQIEEDVLKSSLERFSSD